MMGWSCLHSGLSTVWLVLPIESESDGWFNRVPNQNARETELFDWQNRLERGNQYLKDDFLPICIYIVLALTDFKRETCDESHDGRSIFHISMKTRWRRRLENETKTYPRQMYSLVYGQVWKKLWVAIPTAVYLFNFSDHSGGPKVHQYD